MQTTIRGRACAVLRHRGRVLLNRYGGDDFWALPGGSVEVGEFSADALVREVFEETGVKVACGRLVWVIENLFDYRGTHYTEFGFYYEAAWPAEAAIVEGEFAGAEAEQFFRWVAAAEVAAMDLRPSGLKAPLLALMHGEARDAVGHFTFSGV
jgi:8-oxo-dGTP pyrophosphatase MutT (NUDIX family)